MDRDLDRLRAAVYDHHNAMEDGAGYLRPADHELWDAAASDDATPASLHAAIGAHQTAVGLYELGCDIALWEEARKTEQ